MILQVGKIILFEKKKTNFVDLNEKIRWGKMGGGGSQILHCTFAMGGGVIQMRTMCNRGVGGSKNGEKMRM